MLLDLAERGARLGIPPGVRDLAWPYGPNAYIDMRRGMVEWAERNGLTYAPRARACLHWLRTGRCAGRGHGRLDWWVDHVTAWTRDGQPAVMLAHPHWPDQLSDGQVRSLVELACDPQLFVDVDPAHGWYGGNTRPVAIWWRGGVT